MLQNQNISSYAENIIDEFSHLHIIAFNDNQLLAISPKTKKAHFFYEVNEDMSFHFNMLCEVAEKYQQWFIDTVNMLKYKIEPKETATDYFDTIVENS